MIGLSGRNNYFAYAISALTQQPEFEVAQITLKSYAKLNLYLAVINKRRDNYHNLFTLFERISLYDTITLKSRGDPGINIISDSKDIPLDRSNLAFKSAELLQKRFCPGKGVDIKIIKRIPVGGGMGGGSSNAATVLLGLNKLWKLKLSAPKLVHFAGEIGSDVPFFIYRCPFAIGTGRGEKIKPLNSLKKTVIWHILAIRRINVPTPLIFREWDKHNFLAKSALTTHKRNVKILTSALRNKDLVSIKKALFNSLEQPAVKIYPDLAGIRRRLEGLGLECIMMSGSGPTFFALASSHDNAVSVSRQLQNKKLWEIHVVKTT